MLILYSIFLNMGASPSDATASTAFSPVGAALFRTGLSPVIGQRPL